MSADERPDPAAAAVVLAGLAEDPGELRLSTFARGFLAGAAAVLRRIAVGDDAAPDRDGRGQR